MSDQRDQGNIDLLRMFFCYLIKCINGDMHNRAGRTALVWGRGFLVIRVGVILLVAGHIALLEGYFCTVTLLGRCNTHKAGTVR